MGISKDMNNNCRQQKRPYSVSFVVTHQCNLNCVYCYESNKDTRSADAERIKEIISQYLNNEELEEVNIDFFGGEPWLKFDLIKDVCEWVWERSWKNKYIFYTTTNGTLVHGEVKEWLSRNHKRFWCGLSLDGTKDTHDRNRSNFFDKIDKDFFLECWPEQTVKMTISKYSINNLFNDITYVQNLGFRVAGTNFAEGIDWSDKKYVDILCRELEKLVGYYLQHSEIEIAPILKMPLHNCEHEPVTRKWCGTGANMALYDIDGRKYPCQFFTPMTISEKQFEQIKQVDFADDEKFIDRDCFEKCYFYNVCSNCYGANFLANSRLNVRDKSRCRLVKVRAYYAAALQANRLLMNKDRIINSNMAGLQIRAIEKIKKLYEEEFGLLKSNME